MINNIRTADINDFESVRDITQTTIRSVYPNYYPEGAVEFFSAHHSDEKIMEDIEKGCVYLLDAEGVAAGTVTVAGNEINRLFVLPSYQHKGYGRALMDFAEQKIASAYDEVILDASLPAKSIYLKRGYKETEYNKIKTSNGDYLCYDVMRREL